MSGQEGATALRVCTGLAGPSSSGSPAGTQPSGKGEAGDPAVRQAVHTALPDVALHLRVRSPAAEEPVRRLVADERSGLATVTAPPPSAERAGA
ncbi:hypothetical protein GCM10010231_20870 [Streptomyces sindenensis]|nr:hypothetical protein GCM10010231_20870 [Streptomyces sindenensis]